ncbi:MAG TPA: tetratricopeptide repeat protein [Terriglobales bacterium]|nr:tetratricopeptide repeat protein [Terriglobales bacterium]
MKRCVLRWLLLLLVAGSLQAEQVPSTPASDAAIFLWLAGGISNARIQRLAQTWGQAEAFSCPSTPQCNRLCPRALQKAGADSDLIQSLIHQNTDRQNIARQNVVRQSIDPKAASESRTKVSHQSASCACSSPAAEVAALVHNKDFDAAENKTRALLHDDSNNALLHFVLGNILRRQDRFDEALDEFTESSRLLPGFPETHSQLSYLFYRTDDAEDALAEARTALSMDPANAESYRYLGLALYAESHYEAALHAFDESLQREPAASLANADVYFDMGITYRDQGDLRRAAIAYRHALSLRPNFWEAHSNLGVVLHDQGKLDEAVAEYRSAKRLKPEEASVRNNLGNTLCDKEDFDNAIAEFKDLYRQNPQWEGGHNCLARAYMSKRDYPSAIRELQAAIAANPEGAAEHRVLGQALLLSGRDQEAVDVLREAVALNPQSSLAHHYLGTALVNTQQLAEAEKEFREALDLEPSAQNHYSLAACLMALNQYEEALGELEIASRMDPSQNLYRARMQEVVRLITTSK